MWNTNLFIFLKLAYVHKYFKHTLDPIFSANYFIYHFLLNLISILNINIIFAFFRIFERLPIKPYFIFRRISKEVLNTNFELFLLKISCLLFLKMQFNKTKDLFIPKNYDNKKKKRTL